MSAIGTKLDAAQVVKQAYDESLNRIRVDAQVTAVIGQVQVEIDAADGDNIAISDGTHTASVDPNGGLNVNIISPLDISIDAATGDNIAISDGTNTLSVNSNGSINVNVVSSALITKNIFNEIASVASGVTSTIVSFVALNHINLISVDAGGENSAVYSVYINGALVAKKYTYFTRLDTFFNFNDGLPVSLGNQVRVDVIHYRPETANFNANILIKE